jgi:hypothetical protein
MSSGAHATGGRCAQARTGISGQIRPDAHLYNADGSLYFGTSVALSGDLLAVGASAERSAATGVNGNQTDNTTSDAGAVYVFSRTGTTWVQQAYVKASNPGGNKFGFGVALSGDTLVVGGPLESGGATGINGTPDVAASGAGAVYLFR